MNKTLLQRDLSAIFADAETLGECVLRVGGTSVPCEPAQPFSGLSPDLSGEWGEESGRVIVRTGDLPRFVKVGDPCTYNGERRRISGMERNVDGLTVEITLSGVRA